MEHLNVFIRFAHRFYFIFLLHIIPGKINKSEQKKRNTRTTKYGIFVPKELQIYDSHNRKLERTLSACLEINK